MAKRKKAEEAGHRGSAATLELPKAEVKPPILPTERSDKQCSRCSGKLEAKGEYIVQYSRSRLIEANSLGSNNPELAKLQKTRMPTNQEIFACAPHIQLCRQCSVQTLRHVVIEQRAPSELVSVVVNTHDYEPALHVMLREGIRGGGQVGHQISILRRVGEVTTYQISDMTNGRFDTFLIGKNNASVSTLNATRLKEYDAKAFENAKECPLLEELLELTDRVSFRERARLGALPKELFDELTKAALAKGKKVPKTKPDTAGDQNDDDVLEIELEDDDDETDDEETEETDDTEETEEENDHEPDNP